MTLAVSSLAAPPASDRVRLARVALGAALTVPDVVRAEAGHGSVFVIPDDPAPLRGVSVVVEPDGRYSIALRLVARPVPLFALGQAVRDQLLAIAARENLLPAVGPIDVDFVDVAAPGEEAAAVPAAPAPAGTTTPAASVPAPVPDPATPAARAATVVDEERPPAARAAELVPDAQPAGSPPGERTGPVASPASGLPPLSAPLHAQETT